MPEDPARWTVHGTRRVFASEWVNVDLDDVEIPGHQRFEHHVIRFPRVSVGAVVIDGDRVLLLWRHRFTTDTWGWEIPAGWADDGEDALEAARREVLEETGYQADTVTPLIVYSPMTGISDQRFQVFLASDVQRVGIPDAAEASRVEWVPIADLRSLIASEQIGDGPSLTALSSYLVLR
ncbi:NUDIX hydrolase [Actinokineospora xionganensis]|uniref:NUDIX hydrolase n=1 Tax=Actinokineospora xionganensis TaxID=2684470 RepID=A0ABR7L9C7_9PSEU|nr:NUDIX hydrolase [Actinokineospora xionganensis]MBC6448912.1 NUDIX hydrolase [Actinokineospora xionganensis]